MTRRRQIMSRQACWRSSHALIPIVVLGLFCARFAFSQETRDSSAFRSVDVKTVDENESDLTKTPIVVKKNKDDRSKAVLNDSSYYRSIVSVVGSLALTISVFLGGIFILKLLAPNKFSRNTELVEIVDSCCLNRKSELLTIKWGAKLILLSSSDDKTVPVSEISDSKEIEKILLELRERKSKRCAKRMKVANIGQFFPKKTREQSPTVKSND